MADVTTGMLNGDIPYLAMGQGPPLVMAMGLTGTHEVPTGWERRFTVRTAGPLATHFRVHVVNRKAGLRPGESMSEIAGHLVEAIEKEIGEPVLLTGTSTGGSVALQVAVDRPDLVRALVVVAAAYRLGDVGRRVQLELARSTRAGDAAQGWAQMMTAMLPDGLQAPAQPLVRRMVGSMAPADPSDLLATLDAEDAFDVRESLHRVSAPTLVLGGDKDVFYSRALFEQTAAGIPDGTAHVFPGWGHMRTSTSAVTANISLGFFLAAAARPSRGGRPDS